MPLFCVPQISGLFCYLLLFNLGFKNYSINMMEAIPMCHMWDPKNVRSFLASWFIVRPDDDPAGSKHVATLIIINQLCLTETLLF